MVEKTPNEVVQDIFKHNLKASENTRTLFNGMPQEDAEIVIQEEYERLMSTVQDPQRAEDATMLLQRLAQGLESEALLEVVIEEAESNEMLDLEQGQKQ